ncbi:MAG: DICT sensory domain-containing protein [Nocardioidaceae bacterium]
MPIATTPGPSLDPAPAVDDMLTIGRLAERTGMTPDVLRIWETRHGFPVPVRLPSGHRRYRASDVDAVLAVLGLREGGLRLEQAIAQVRRAGATSAGSSVYAALRREFPELPSYSLTKQSLLALSWAIEDESVAQARHPLLIGAFQRGRFLDASQARWRELARSARASWVLAELAESDDSARPRRVALDSASPLLREWVVVCEDPGLSAALVAWEIPGQDDVPDRDRMFEAVWSLEPAVVRSAGLVSLRVAADSGSEAAREELARLASVPLPPPAPQRVASGLFARMVAYADGTILLARRRR